MTTASSNENGAWWRELNRYHWFVLVVASLGWLFDCLDQQLFNLARRPAMIELLGKGAAPGQIDYYAGVTTAIFLLGWATGGLVFGMLGDRIGRARTMMFTILLYSFCTGLSAFSTTVWDFAFYRFITGLGVGGEFAVGVALVAEVMPDRARPMALGLLQAFSAIGNVSAALISMGLGTLEQQGVLGKLNQWGAWRWMFVIGALPALLALVVRSKLQEPERWVQLKQQSKNSGIQLGSYALLFRDPRWRRNAIVGVLLACSGVIGLWGIAFFSVDLTQSVLKEILIKRGVSGAQLSGSLKFWAGVASIMINIGAFLGMIVFTRVTQRIGRKPAFAISFTLAMVSTAGLFWFFNDFSHLFWMMPIMGFCVLSLFGGYAIYFPELFPTSIRSTGTSFCYNVGRFVAALGPLTLGYLTRDIFGHLPKEMPLRYAGICMCAVFLIGLAVLPFAPETRGQPLPDEDRAFTH